MEVRLQTFLAPETPTLPRRRSSRTTSLQALVLMALHLRAPLLLAVERPPLRKGSLTVRRSGFLRLPTVRSLLPTVLRLLLTGLLPGVSAPLRTAQPPSLAQTTTVRCQLGGSVVLTTLVGRTTLITTLVQPRGPGPRPTPPPTPQRTPVMLPRTGKGTTPVRWQMTCLV